MTARGLWLRVCVGPAVAVALLLAVAPERPQHQLPVALALATGLAAGAALYVLAVRAPLTKLGRSASFAVAVSRHAFFALLATDEEIVCRRVTLGVLLPRGVLLALVVSTVAFALAHRGRVGLHLVTGGVFGAVYIATGFLAAAIGAHWTYNELVARARPTAPT
jgi:membrane protease YdiL (CAAX protease family)